ncbi:unnamed protein product, partial [Effrenium voratum]
MEALPSERVNLGMIAVPVPSLQAPPALARARPACHAGRHVPEAPSVPRRLLAAVAAAGARAGPARARRKENGPFTFQDSTPDMLLEWLNKKVPKQDSPEAVLKAIDDFAWTEQWMMNVGDVKGKVLDVALREALRLHPTGVFTALELGTYLGYSAVRIARLLPSRGRLLSVDSAPQEVAEE